MNELDLVEIKEDRPMTTSIMIGEVFGKEHYNILAKMNAILTPLILRWLNI